MSQWRNPQHKENSCKFQQIISGLSLNFSWSLWESSFLPFSHFLYSTSFLSLLLLFTLVHMFQDAVSNFFFLVFLSAVLILLQLLIPLLAIKLIWFFTFFLIFHYHSFFLCIFSYFSPLLLPPLLPFSLLLFSPSISFLYLLLNGATYFLRS